MPTPTWSPLWSNIVYSSIWDEPDHVCKVFLTMLALKESDHTVRLNAYQLGKLVSQIGGRGAGRA